MSDWISQIARELEATEEFVNEFLITYVRERTKRRVSPQEILEAIRVVKTHPPLRRQHPKKTRTNTTEAVILYLRNPVRYNQMQKQQYKEQEELKQLQQKYKKQHEPQQLENETKLAENQKSFPAFSTELSQPRVPPPKPGSECPHGLGAWCALCSSVTLRSSQTAEVPARGSKNLHGEITPFTQQPGFTRLQNQVRTELASPDFTEGAHGLAIHRQDLQQFLRLKWQEITSIERSFGLARDKVHEVKVDLRLLNRLGIERFRFRQQGFAPPAVGVDLMMQHEVVCQCALDATGRLQPHPGLDQLFPADYQLLLNLAAVVHYADLVVPREPTRLQPATSATEISRLQSFPEGITEEPSQSVRTKRIPRPKPSTASHRAPRSRVTGTKRPSRVDPFRRRLPAGQKPSFAKVVEADQAGISLRGPGYPEMQYTFVRAHIRGEGHTVPQYVYADYQAVKTFEHLLNVLGFP